MTIAVIMSPRFPVAPERTAENNPDKFYLWSTGKAYSFTFTYNPHAADAWMFKTAEGHLEVTNPESLPVHGRN